MVRRLIKPFVFQYFLYKNSGRLRLLSFYGCSIILICIAGCASTSYLSPTDAQGETRDAEDESPKIAIAEFVDRAELNKRSAGKTSAAELPISQTSFSLADVLETAFQNNPTFAEFAANRQLARSAVLEAIAWYNPELDSGLRYVSGGDDGVEYELALRQPFEFPVKRRTRRQATEAIEAVAQREEISFQVMLRAEVVKAYSTVVYHETVMGLTTKDFDLAQEIVKIVQGKVDAGNARPIDVTRAKVEMLKVSREIQSAQRLRNVARDVMNALTGRSLPPNFELSDSLPTHFEPIDTRLILVQAQVQNPELQRLLALKKQKILKLKQEQVSWYPNVTPGISFEQEEDAENYIVSLGFEIPLWSRNQGGIARAHAELSQIDAQILRTNQEIMRDAETTIEAYSGALEQILALDELRAAAAEALKTETFLYDQGVVDFISLLDVRRMAQETEAEYLAALYEAHLFQIKIEQSIGVLGSIRSD